MKMAIVLIIIAIMLISCTLGQIQSFVDTSAGSFKALKWNDEIGIKTSSSLESYASRYEISSKSTEFYYLANDLFNDGKAEEALSYLNKSIKASPNNLASLLLYCDVSLDLGNAAYEEGAVGSELGKSRLYAERAANLAFDVPEVQYILGRIYFAKGKYIQRSKWTRRAFFAIREAAYLGSQEAWEMGNRIWNSAASEDATVWCIKDDHNFYDRWGKKNISNNLISPKEAIVFDPYNSDKTNSIPISSHNGIISNKTEKINNEESDKILGLTSHFQIYNEPPVPIRKIEPQYPDFAKKAGIEGKVWLEVEVFTDGNVGAINVVVSLMSGPSGLDEAAINAVKQWKFQPATKRNGKPVAVWVTIPINFNN